MQSVILLDSLFKIQNKKFLFMVSLIIDICFENIHFYQILYYLKVTI